MLIGIIKVLIGCFLPEGARAVDEEGDGVLIGCL